MGWQETGSVAPRSLSATRLELHHGVQVLGAAAHALLELREDDSHTNLGYDGRLRSLSTRPLGPEPGVSLHLDLPTATLVLRRQEQSLCKLALRGRRLSDALDWASERYAELSGTRTQFELREYSDFPASPLGSGAAFGGVVEAQAAELARWFGNGLGLLEDLRDEFPGLSPARVWPHHFDLGALLPLGGGEQRMLGLGLSPGDSYYDQPYLYCSPYPQPKGDERPELEVGHWHARDFVSAIATAEELQAQPSQARAAREYLQTALAACRELLG